jgi:hypothetical protein
VNKILIAFVLLIACTVSICASGESTGLSDKTAVVMIDKKPSGFVNMVNSQVPSKGLFKALIDLHASGVSRVAVMVHEDATLKMVTDLKGLLSKAGFLPVRVFYFGKDKDWMQEIDYSPSNLFSENLDELKRLPMPAIELDK